MCYFLLAYTTSTIFYLLHDDVIRSSAISLHLTFDLGFAHIQRTALCLAASNDRGINSNKPAAVLLCAPTPCSIAREMGDPIDTTQQVPVARTQRTQT